MQNLGNKLKTLRKEYGYSIKNIVEKFDEINYHITAKTIYRWESNKVVPELKAINVLANIYNVRLTSLYEDSKFCKSLNENESKFIYYLRNNSDFKKIMTLLLKFKTED